MFDVVQTHGCFDQFDSWFRDQVGKQVYLRFGDEPVTQPSRVYSPIGPEQIRITSESPSMIQRVFTYLSQ